MAFAGRTSAPAPSPSAPAGAPPPPPAFGAAPPPPPPVAAPGREVYVAVNGQSVLKTEAEARLMPPTTPALFKGEEGGGWKTIQQLFPAPAAPAVAPAHQVPYGAPGQPAAPTAGSAVPANIFAGVENAQVSRRGANITAGDYVARLLSAEFKTGRNGNYIILEMACVESSYDQARPETHGCNHQGSTFTIFIKQNDSFLGNLKEVILALSGFDDQGRPRDETEVVTQAECNALVSKEQPYAGVLVYLEAREITTRQNKPFTRVNWWPCPIMKDAAGNIVPDLNKLAQGR